MRQQRLLELSVWEHIPGWRALEGIGIQVDRPRYVPHAVCLRILVAHLDDLETVPAPGRLIKPDEMVV
jgi:hypothetical protein